MTATVKPASGVSRNGTTPDVFPVDSFREAAPHLRRPFTPAAVKFKVQATWPSGGLIVAYIDARLTVERLNLICPHLWHDAYRPVTTDTMWCDLTVDNITRSDIGEGTKKGLVSDALKRAAVKFGVGVSLYAIPTLILNNEHLDRKQRGQKETVTIKPSGDRVVRAAYEAWLDLHGIHSFGQPLDHGDVAGAQGDTEIPEGVDPATGEVEAVAGLSLDAAEALIVRADGVGISRGKLQLAVSHAAGRDFGDLTDLAVAIEAVAGLTVAQAAKIDGWISQKMMAAVTKDA